MRVGSGVTGGPESAGVRSNERTVGGTRSHVGARGNEPTLGGWRARVGEVEGGRSKEGE
jgi:hypothetical protein